MFWDKGYAPSANIEALLEKENSTLEEFLDEEDILQECKTQKKNLVNYFTRPEVIRRLVELITTEPSEDVPMAQRFRYANMSCEILTLGLPSLDEKLLNDAETLQLLYSYLEKEPPLNPLLSSFFSKTFSMLFTKKPDQDWFLYQHMCLQLLEYIKSQKTFLDFICKHFDTPVIPDLIMQMMKDIEGGQLKRNLFEWLTEDKIVERLIAILRNPQETDKHANVADFFCDLINQGRLMRQTEQENDSFEPAFDGSNPILKTIESADTIEALLNVILEPNAQESAILSGISVVLTLIKPITFKDEPNLDRQILLETRELEFHQAVQETVITVMAPRLEEFVHVLKNPPAVSDGLFIMKNAYILWLALQKPTLETTAAVLTPPFGKTRLQVCRVFTALLETKHETIQKSICSTEYFSLLLEYFKQYCWNNFLHTELEKALHLVFNNEPTTANNMTEPNIFPMSCAWIFNAVLDGTEFTLEELKDAVNKSIDGGKEEVQQQEANIEIEVAAAQDAAAANEEKQESTSPVEVATEAKASPAEEVEAALKTQENHVENNEVEVDRSGQNAEPALNDLEKTMTLPSAPSEMQAHVSYYRISFRLYLLIVFSSFQLIVNCQLVSKLVDYWQHNAQAQSAEKGRRLGYMGHLIKILRYVTNCISASEHIAALIKTSLSDEGEQKIWQSLIDTEAGEFTLAVKQQTKLLADCNPHDENEDYVGEMNAWNVTNLSYSNMGYSDLDNTLQDIVFTMDNDQNLFQFGRNIDDEDDDDDEHGGEHPGSGDGHGHGMFTKNSITLNNLADPWDMDVQFSDIPGVSAQIDTGTANWGTDFNADNFADFDAHFSTFGSDLGKPSTALPDVEDDEQGERSAPFPTGAPAEEQQSPERTTPSINDQQAEYDNNANVEKAISDKLLAESSTVETASIVTRLQSVLLDGEEDYEDDEGMWTKPLGGADRQTEATEQPTPISNGPTSKVNEFNHANDNSSSNVDGQQHVHEQANITAEQQKLAASAKTNNVEIATTTT
ncbi:hypothetical protein KR200_003659 [Drosophila serrata]|nr:hypothetical protein KR200_003659 [Drosophila serrata]